MAHILAMFFKNQEKAETSMGGVGLEEREAEAGCHGIITWVWRYVDMGVSKNNGTPKWMVYNGTP